MKYYVQFFDTAGLRRSGSGTWENDPNPRECLGSAQVFILDGRNTLAKMITDAEERAKSIKGIYPSLVGYEIRRGERILGSYNLCFRNFKLGG